MEQFNRVILVFRYVLFPVGTLSKQKRVVLHGMRKTRKLKVRHYADHMIDLNEYSDAFPGAKASKKLSK